VCPPQVRTCGELLPTRCHGLISRPIRPSLRRCCVRWTPTLRSSWTSRSARLFHPQTRRKTCLWRSKVCGVPGFMHKRRAHVGLPETTNRSHRSGEWPATSRWEKCAKPSGLTCRDDGVGEGIRFGGSKSAWHGGILAPTVDTSRQKCSRRLAASQLKVPTPTLLWMRLAWSATRAATVLSVRRIFSDRLRRDPSGHHYFLWATRPRGGIQPRSIATLLLALQCSEGPPPGPEAARRRGSSHVVHNTCFTCTTACGKSETET